MIAQVTAHQEPPLDLAEHVAEIGIILNNDRGAFGFAVIHKDIHLEGAVLNVCYLKKIELGFKSVPIGMGSDMKGPSEVFLREAYLQRAKLQGATLRGAHLEGAKMHFAHLEDADISEAHLEGARLLEANLRGAYLSEAKLQGADFSRAIVN